FSGHTRKGQDIQNVNSRLQDSAGRYGYTYIDVHTFFANAAGKLKAGLSNDGLHLNGSAYLLWKHIVYPYVYDLQAKPSLLPAPQLLSWHSGYFPLHACGSIIISDPALQKEGRLLQQYLEEKGIAAKLADRRDEKEPAILLQLDKNFKAPAFSEEAY